MSDFAVEWRKQRERPRLLTGAAAGLLASAVVGQVDRMLDPLISTGQRWRDRALRSAPPHQLAATLLAQKITGRRLGARDQRKAQAAFNLAYGLGWGLVYHAVRTRVPRLARYMGFPFGIAFFLACDGVIAPLLKLSPPVRRIPWQPNAKELTNHTAWAITAELVQRSARRLAALV